MLPKLQYIKIDALDAIEIATDDYDAIILLQGAQLIHFSTKYDTSNWVWVSDKAEYKLGESVRGGIPICWPVFGQFDANPQAVKDSFIDCPFDISQHGYARTQRFEVDLFNPLIVDRNLFHHSQLKLRLAQPVEPKPKPNLDLEAIFTFGVSGLEITLKTTNNTEHSVTFSQALHTYLPTEDITQTTVSGFDGIHYSDTLTEGWQTKTQQGDISLNSEVDRIYHGAPSLSVITPDQTPVHLQATGSNSTVVWNPWQEKSKNISQFAEDDYQRMLCVETANAHLDVVELGAGQVWEMGVCIGRNA